MKRFLFVLLAFTTFVSAYSNVNDDKRIKHALLKYNTGIVKMTRSGDTKC